MRDTTKKFLQAQQFRSNMLHSLKKCRYFPFDKGVLTDKTQERMGECMEALFTEQEIVDLTDFYSTPLGQKYVQAVPEIVDRSEVASREIISEMTVEKMTATLSEIKDDTVLH